MCEFQEKKETAKNLSKKRQDKIEPKQTIYHGEFDPGSGRTLAACLTHASRTERPSLLGTRVANG